MDTVLVMIDFQQAFDNGTWGERNNLFAEENAKRLLAFFRERELPIVHIQHVSPIPESQFYEGKAGCAFKAGFEPLACEVLFQKAVNSAFIGTALEAYLRKEKLETLVICGLTLPHCVSTTTRMAANLGFSAYLISDATASFALSDVDNHLLSAELIHRVNLASLKDEFATILSTDEMLAHLAKKYQT